MLFMDPTNSLLFCFVIVLSGVQLIAFIVGCMERSRGALAPWVPLKITTALLSLVSAIFAFAAMASAVSL